MESPQILCLNVQRGVIEQLEGNSYNIYDGNVGKITNLNLNYNQQAKLSLISDIPRNFHEFDIVILDLTNDESIHYNSNDYTINSNKSHKSAYFECHYPQTVFDPRPLVLSSLHEKIQAALNRSFLLIIFCSHEEGMEYHYREEFELETLSVDLYSFIEDYLPDHFNIQGSKTKTIDSENELHQFLKKYNSGITYDIGFQHPTIYRSHKNIPDRDFYPLIYNNQEDIISFCRFPTEQSGIFFFPKVREQSKFLLEFLKEIAPSIFPALFPENLKNSWTSYKQYYLPNQERLVNELQEIHTDYKNKLENKNIEIASNYEHYAFLHEMLTETDVKLVKAVIKYFEWLGFTNVIDGDEINAGVIKEEDIQIETDKGLLIFEVKGLGATSKDSDCSQIGKVRYRRSIQRNAFDVYASYIVNHQRHLPPLDRKNPPFTLNQLEDAKNDKRGLLTTWQLFNRYFDIEEGIFTKEQVIEAFYNYGLIDFLPKNYLRIGIADKFFKGNTIAIVTLPSDITLELSDKILIEYEGEFSQFSINSLQIDNKSVSSANNVEVGIQFNGVVPKNGCFYKVIV